jgi:O-methyltransferase
MGLRSILGLKGYDYRADGFAVRKRNLSFFKDKLFASAWEETRQATARGFKKGKVPDVRWRAFTGVRAAEQALLTDGDFVECGVHNGLLSGMICRCLDFSKIARTFFLFDTFQGIPLAGLRGAEAQGAAALNAEKYGDYYEIAASNFGAFPNVKLVRGSLPGTLAEIDGRKIAYLSIDLNSATYEMQVIGRLWEQLSQGAVVVVDDYGFINCKDQYEAWNDFAKKVGHPIFYLPTGQGMIFK